MGGYIPPPNEGGSNGKGEDDNKDNDNKRSSLNPFSKSSVSATSEVETSLVSSFIQLFRWNPSCGLFLWGPLIPAADEKPALLALTNCQVILGILCFRRFRNLRRLKVYGTANKTKFFVSKMSTVLFGSSLVVLSGFEYGRLSLHYDPWYEEATKYRKLATKFGQQPSRWFGAINYYTPMSFEDWIDQVQESLVYSSQRRKLDDKFGSLAITTSNSNDSNSTNNIINNNIDYNHNDRIEIKSEIQEPIIKAEVNQGNNKFDTFHKSIEERNLSALKQMLLNLQNVNELNKAERLDAIMEGKSDVKYNEAYAKQPIHLGVHRMETDDDFEVVWQTFEPWDEMKLETTYDIRLIPKWSIGDEVAVDHSSNNIDDDYDDNAQ